MQDAPLRTERKDLLDVVTEADLAAEEIVVSGLMRLTPQAAILAEERGAGGDAAVSAGSSIRSTAPSTTPPGCRGFR